MVQLDPTNMAVCHGITVDLFTYCRSFVCYMVDWSGRTWCHDPHETSAPAPRGATRLAHADGEHLLPLGRGVDIEISQRWWPTSAPVSFFYMR